MPERSLTAPRALAVAAVITSALAACGGARGTPAADGPLPDRLALTADRARYAVGDLVTLELTDPAGRIDEAALCKAHLELRGAGGWTAIHRHCIGCERGEGVCVGDFPGGACWKARRTAQRRLAGLPGGTYRFVVPYGGRLLATDELTVVGPPAKVARPVATSSQVAEAGAPPTGQVRVVGRVIDETGKAIDADAVTLTAADGTPIEAGVEVGCDGRFEVLGPPGEHRLALTHEGLTVVYPEPIKLMSGMRTEIEIVDEPDCEVARVASEPCPAGPGPASPPPLNDEVRR